MLRVRWLVVGLISALAFCTTARAQTPPPPAVQHLPIPGKGELPPGGTVEFQRPADCAATCPDSAGLTVVSEAPYPLSLSYDGAELRVSVARSVTAPVYAAFASGCSPGAYALIVGCRIAPGRGRPFPTVMVTTLAIADIPGLHATQLPERGVAGTPVTYSVEVSPATVAPSVQVQWDFGDGSTAAGTSVDHVFAAAGRYPVRATADVPRPFGGTETQHVSVLTTIRDPAVAVARFPQTEGTDQPCPLTQATCDFAQQLSDALARGDATGVLARWPPTTITCDEELIQEADSGIACFGAQPGDQQEAYLVSGGDTGCGPACVGAPVDRDTVVAIVQQLAGEAQPDEVDGYGPGNLHLLGFLSPIDSYWGQNGPNQLVVLLTDIAPFDVHGSTRQLIGVVVQADEAGNPLGILLLNTVTLADDALDQFTPPGYLSSGFLPWAPGGSAQSAQRSIGAAAQPAACPASPPAPMHGQSGC